ncbi:serine/threonine-protein kinase [Streptomyces sp. NPDC021093]|uniref:serine/threonine-protein kinase n=1 Tax=Streptomyces sp. NPDC021093 TaxID=3365112 RepID=UPI00378C61CB
MAAAAAAAGPAQYHIVAPLGEGGMGRVHLARSPAGRLVALKTVHPHLAADPRFRERFRREVAAARAVDDVFTAAVLDSDTDAELPWLASEFCAGPSLVDAISTLGPLDSAALGTLGAALAEALAAVHAAGLVHRDLKPANVVITRDGPKILDFGIAKDATDACGEPLTDTGELVGTLGFIAPEQLTGGRGGEDRSGENRSSKDRGDSGRDDEVGPPADVFALGSLLALSSTGRNPYGSGTAPQVLHRTLHEPPDLLGVPDEEWLGFLRRCLAMAPADRPSVAEVLDWCAGRAGAVPWWEEEPITGAVREHEEAMAELIAAEPEWEDEIPEAFRAPRAPVDVADPDRAGTNATDAADAPAPKPTPRRRRFLAWAGAAVTAVSGSTTAAVLLLDESLKTPPRAKSDAPRRSWRQGSTVWSRDLGATLNYGGELLLHGDALYVRTDRTLTRLNAATGEVLWRYEAEGGNLGSVRPQGDTVFVLRLPMKAPEIVALDAATGTRRWSTGDPVQNRFRPSSIDPAASNTEGPSARLSVSPAVVCLVTYATASTLWEQRATKGNRWRAYGFGARDGKPLWHRAGTVTGVPAVHQYGGRLAVATAERPVSLREPADGPLVVLRERDGTQEREIEGGSVHPEAHPGSSGIRHYPGRSAVEAVDLATGKRRWSRAAGDEATVTPAATAGLVHTGTNGDLRALDAATGHQRWARADVRRIDDDDEAPPLVADGLVYASGSDPSVVSTSTQHSDGWGLHALKAETGELVWAMPVDRMSKVRAAAGGGRVHLCVDRTLLTLRGPAGS